MDAVKMSPVEIALLSGTWDAAIPASPAADLAKLVVDGSFHEALTSQPAKSLFTLSSASHPDSPTSTWFTHPPSESDEDETARLAIAVACLHAFLQLNWTGPHLDFGPLSLLTLPQSFQTLTDDDLQAKAVAELAYGGEPAYHLAASLAFLRFAQILLDDQKRPFAHVQSAPWWRLRLANVHSQVLDDPVPLPSSVLHAPDALHAVLTKESDPDLNGRLYLEQGLLQHHTGQDATAAEYFLQATRALGLSYGLTGALGKRTKFQQTDVTQLILLAEGRKRSGSDEGSTSNGAEPNDIAAPETIALNDDTLLEHTQFTSSLASSATHSLSHLDPNAQPALHPLEQSALLALCLNVQNTSPVHGLTQEQMSPYVARVVQQPANWSVHTMALLLRSRLESGRTRTVERSALQLQALIDQMPSADASLPDRLRYIHALPLPSKWRLERELALRFLSLGVTRSALEIFSRLQMWEEAVQCHMAMEQRREGVALVRALLAGDRTEADVVLSRAREANGDGGEKRTRLDAAREAKLWCLLGDLEPEHAVEHYERAWAVSGESSGRAMRSLGAFYIARGRFADAIAPLQAGLRINPLVHRAWFLLGCACVREERWTEGRTAFARCVSIENEDAESWANLASCYLRMEEAGVELEEEDEDVEAAGPSTDADENEKPTPRVPFAHKTLAFRALQHGLKFAYENWRMWQNYIVVSLSVGEFAETTRAMGRVVELRADKDGASCVDADVLARLVNAVCQAPYKDPEDGAEGPTELNPNEGKGLYPRVLDLFERTLLTRVSGNADVYRAYARLLTWSGRWADALQAHMDAYRAGPAPAFDAQAADVAAFREAAREVEDVVDALRNFGPKAGSESRWVSQARSVVRTFLGRARDFEEEREYEGLKEVLDELKNES